MKTSTLLYLLCTCAALLGSATSQIQIKPPVKLGGQTIGHSPSPTGNAAVCSDQAALLFRSRIGVDFKEPSPWMSFVSFSPDGSMVASGGAAPDGSAGGLTFWSFPEGKYIRTVNGKPIVISHDWTLLAAEGALIDLNSGKTIFKDADLKFTAACFSPDAKYFVAAPYAWERHRGPKRITVINTSDGSTAGSFCTRYTSAVAFSPDGRTLASGHWDNVTLWDLPRGDRIALLRGFGRYVYGVTFSDDGRLLAAGTDDGHLQIWDVGARRCMQSLRVGYGDVSSPAFSPDGRVVAAGTYGDGTLSLVDVESGKLLAQAKVSMFGCGSVAFSPDGRYLVVPSNGGQIGPRRFDTGGTIRVYELRLDQASDSPAQR